MVDAIQTSTPAPNPPPRAGMLPLERFQEVFPGRDEGELRDIREEFYLLAGLVIDIIQDEGAAPPHDLGSTAN